MKRLVKIVLGFLVFTLLLFHSPSLTQAANEFFISYNVVYEASTDGSLWITQEVSLTNKFSNIYATEYSFKLEKIQPQSIQAYDQTGPIPFTTEENNNITTINLHFNQQVVGKNKTLKFSLKYAAPELLYRSGQVWEITIPKLVDAQDIDEYRLTLKAPSAFGKPAYISPDPQNQKSEENNQLFFFDKNQVSSTGVIASFGEFQVFDFSLTYHLYNPTSQTALTSLAFPPDTSYQKLTYRTIKPQPEKIEVDEDNNWLGIYKLSPKERYDVIASGQVKIFAHPHTTLTASSSSDDLQKYLQPQKYWESENPQIRSLAQKLKTPKAIYDYVVSTLEYDYSRIRKGSKRLGATEILLTPQRAICMEYTDLFIALARAAGIPARELNGFAYTTNPALQPLSLVQDILHAWPEYWDNQKKTWIQVDPTWGDTTGGVDYFSKLDLGHFVFAVHGLQSQLPLPAGSYKTDTEVQKDVEVIFGQYKEPVPPTLQADFLLPKKLITERPTEGKIRITNAGSEALYNLSLTLKTKNLKLLTSNTPSFVIMPPFAIQEIPLKVAAPSFTSGAGKIIISGNNQKFEYNLTYESIILSKILPILGSLILLLGIFTGIKLIKSRIRRK